VTDYPEHSSGGWNVSKELWQESASTLAQLIRSGQTSSREVVTAHLARIDDVNGAVNAIVEVRPEEALAEADAADKALKLGEPLGALHGVPFTVKTNLDVAGYATNEGTVVLKDFVASADSPTVEKRRSPDPNSIGATAITSWSTSFAFRY